MTSEEIDKLLKENARMRRTLASVERYANHHGIKPQISAREALSMIQHHPCIEEITLSYIDGVIPNTPNPYAEMEKMRLKQEDLSVPSRESFEKWYRSNVDPNELFKLSGERYENVAAASVWEMWQSIHKEITNA